MDQVKGRDAAAILELLPAYRTLEGVFDELIHESSIRPEYRRLIGIDPKLSGPEVYMRWRSAKQSLKDNPPASTGQSIRHGVPQSWELDPIPLVISEKEWSSLSSGLQQRMELLDMLLRDVFGPQRLLNEGILPPELVFGSPWYLRAARRPEKLYDQRMLFLYAAQISRSGNGQWQVLADRTQGPSGCGHAVENRLAMSRILSEDFQKMNVRRLAGFFATLRQSLQEASPFREKGSRSALLSPGVRSQTYFEDAYLARYLGYTLTQTADLTVRGGAVYLKTLGGLVRIDSILRRLPDIMCDPLEIDPSSSEGIPGLAQSARENQVLLANSLGTGWSETPGITAILPRLCKALMGQELRLNSLPMWWCGDPDSMQYVVDNIDRLLLRDAFTRHSSMQTVGHHLDKDQRAAIIADIKKSPWRFVASSHPEFSRSPAWIHNHIVSCGTVVRIMGCATRDKFEIMPGGIARIADSTEKLDESLICGNMSKDVWVLGSGPAKPFSLLTSTKQSVELRRSALDLPSRVAEHLFWLGRFAERTEFMARHARYCSAQLTSEVPAEALSAYWMVVRALCDVPKLPAEVPVDEVAALQTMRRAVLDFVFHQNDFDALSSSVNGILRNAETIRDRLSFDSWQILSRLDYSVLTSYGGRMERMGESLTLLNQVIVSLSAFAGLASESMTRGPGWHFLDLGRRIERAQNLLRLIEVLLVPFHKSPRQLLESLLDICDSSITYRYRYLMSYEIGPVLDLLVADPSNPRGLAFQFVQILNHLDAIPASDKAEVARHRKKITECRGTLRLFDGEAFGDHVVNNESGRLERPLLYKCIHDFTAHLHDLSDYISRRFLTHTSPQQLEDMVNQ